mgnify:CR=1 FL=1
MQAVILAAGRGKRLGHFTDRLPKPMVRVKNKPVLEYVLDNLPSAIREVIIVRGYRGNVITDYFGDDHHGRDIYYVDMPELLGTAVALHLARPQIGSGRFLVINGGDFHARNDLEKLLLARRALGVAPPPAGILRTVHIKTDEEHRVLCGFAVATDIHPDARMASGAYVLDGRIFDYNTARGEDGEYDLPQTVLRMAQDVPVYAVPMPRWRSIAYSGDVERLNGFR